jgi:hypothetical protein
MASQVAVSVGTACVLVLGGIAGGAVAASPIGDAQGRALLARVHAAYLHSAGVQMAVISRGPRVSSFGQFLVQLRRGVDVAEEFIGAGADGTEIVERRGGPAYERDAARNCWRPLAASDPRTLVDVGLPYPDSNLPSKVMQPRHEATAWLLSTEDREYFWFLATQATYHPIAKRFVSYTIDAQTLLIRSISMQALQNGTMDVHARRHPKLIWLTAKLRVRTLAAPPLIASAKPSC